MRPASRCVSSTKRAPSNARRIRLPEYTNEIWHVHVPDIGPGTIYGYRVDGPYEPEAGHRFNKNKLLLDPYARAHIGELQWHDACFGYTIGASGDDLTFDPRDSAPYVPKCVVVDPGFDWHGHRNRPHVPWDRTIVYELHVRGFTKQHPEIAQPLRGTYEGLGSPAVIGVYQVARRHRGGTPSGSHVRQ